MGTWLNPTEHGVFAPTRRVRVLDQLWCLSTSKTILTILKKDYYGRKYRRTHYPGALGCSVDEYSIHLCP